MSAEFVRGAGELGSGGGVTSVHAALSGAGDVPVGRIAVDGRGCERADHRGQLFLGVGQRLERLDFRSLFLILDLIFARIRSALGCLGFGELGFVGLIDLHEMPQKDFKLVKLGTRV